MSREISCQSNSPVLTFMRLKNSKITEKGREHLTTLKAAWEGKLHPDASDTKLDATIEIETETCEVEILVKDKNNRNITI